MSGQTARRFSLADAMILVAATAVGLALARIHYRSLADFDPFESPYQSSASFLVRHLPSRAKVSGISPLLVSWSIVLFVLHLRRPRPALRRLVRSRGFVATLGVTLGLGFWISTQLSGLIQEIREGDADHLAWTFTRDLAEHITPAVGMGWVIVALAGHWRRPAEIDWRGHLGRILGWCWLALFFLVATVFPLLRS